VDSLRALIVAGWRGALPRGPYGTPQLVRLEAIAAAVLAHPEGTVLVLGGEALAELRPDHLAGRIAFPLCIAFAVQQGTSMEIVSVWVRSGVAEFISLERLTGRIAEAVRIPVRVAVPQEEWAPRGAGEAPLLREAVRVLPTLPSPLVKELCRRMGISGDALRRAARRTLVVAPRDIVHAYMIAVTRRARALDWTESAVARSLGLADTRSLRRLFRRIGERVPRRGTKARGPSESSESSPRPPIRPLPRPRSGS